MRRSLLEADYKGNAPTRTRALTTPIQGLELSKPAAMTALQIDINVIQPTPNISPSHSLRSFSADSKDSEADLSGGGVNENFAGIPFLIVPPSPVRIRRVSFSDTSIDNDSQDEALGCLAEIAPEINISEVDETVTAVRRTRCTRQSSLQVKRAVHHDLQDQCQPPQQSN